MRDPLIKAYGHVYPADAVLEEALRTALADALPDTDDIPLLERDGDMLRIESDDTLVSVGGLGLHPKQVTEFLRFSHQ